MCPLGGTHAQSLARRSRLVTFLGISEPRRDALDAERRARPCQNARGLLGAFFVAVPRYRGS